MKIQYLSLDKLKKLHEIVGFLDTYVPPPLGVKHIIGENLNSENKVLTNFLEQLGEVNKRKKELITLLTE